MNTEEEAETLVGKGIVVRILFLIIYGLGYLFGLVLVRLGLGEIIHIATEREIVDDDVEEMIRKMNEEGPNN